MGTYPQDAIYIWY